MKIEVEGLTLKSLREALCVAQSAVNHTYADKAVQPDYAERYSRIYEKLINEIDRQRPLGPDGKHGKNHTDSCGCDVLDILRDKFGG